MISLQLIIHALNLSINVSKLTAEVQISRMGVVQLSFQHDDYLESEILVAQFVSVCLETSFFHGYITQIHYHGKNTNGYFYTLNIHSLLYPLTQQYQQRVFSQKTDLQIIKSILKDHQHPKLHYKFHVTDDNTSHTYIPQYHQSDFELLLQRCSSAGINFIIQNEAQYPKLIFYDANNQTLFNDSLEILLPNTKGMLIPDDVIIALDYKIETNSSSHITLTTAYSNIHPQQTIQIPELKNFFDDPTFIVNKIKHFANTDNNHRYHNELTLIPSSKTTDHPKPDNIPTTPLPHYCAATIKQTNNNNHDYTITMAFDRTHQHIPKIKYQHPAGCEFQLPENQEVVVANNTPLPIIIGAIPSMTALNPVTNSNATQTKLAMPGNCEWVMEDNPKNPYIKLQANKNNLTLNQQHGREYISLTTQSSDININTKGHLTRSTAADFNCFVNEKFKLNIAENYSINGLSKGMQLQSGKNINLHADHNIHISSAETMKYYAASDLLCKANKNLRYQVNNGGIYIAAQKQNININSTNVEFQNTTNGDMILSAGKSLIRINRQGALEIKCENLVIDAPEIINTGNRLGINSGVVVSGAQPKVIPRPPQSKPAKQRTKKSPIPINVIHTDNDADTQTSSDTEKQNKLAPPIGLYYPAPDNNPYFAHDTQAYAKQHLTQDEINHFKIHGNTATLFIQGFDLPYHDTTHHINAYTWWHHMEENLNQAAGHIANNEKNYKRILNVAWQGDPKNVLDYMAAVENANHVASQLLSIIESLLENGITINIIGHSLGAQVVMRLLDELGKRVKIDPLYFECIANTILWQAALPDNVFSTSIDDKTIDKLYAFPYATLAARRIHVLYSKHDQVVGPMIVPMYFLQPFFKPMPSNKLLYGIFKVIDWLGKKIKLPGQLNCIYAIANLVNKPLSYLFNSHENRIEFYSHWQRRYPRDHQGIQFKNNLQAQQHHIRQQYPHAYNYLSLAIVAYQQGAEQMLAEIINQQVREAGHRLLNFSSISKDVDGYLYVDHPLANELATLLITMFISKDAAPRPALGWHGVANPQHPKIQQLISQNKLILRDQTPFLDKHSGMREPSAELMRQVYKHFVIGESAISNL